MRFLRSFQRITFLFIFLVGIAVTFTAYVAISNIVAEQSRLQQQSIAPVFSLVNEELLKPLHIAQTIGEAKTFNTLLDTADIDEPKLVEILKTLESQFDLTFFAASEKARKQYLSNGNTIDLVEGKVFWYFEAVEQDRELIADLGQVGDVHLYFDFKIRNDQDEFLGFVGVGKSLEQFIERFEQHKAQYGYDFLFINDRNQIMLTSVADLVVTDAVIPTLDALPWYQALGGSDDELNSTLVSVDGEDFLISQINIVELDWKLLLLIPLEARQAQITKTFVTNTVLIVTLVVILFLLMFWLMLLYKRNLEKSIDMDPLSGLPNRTFVHKRYQQFRRMNAQLSVIMVDIDRFKSINDTYGHNTGDEVIQAVSRILTEEVRDQDVVGRWGGEEFIMLVPSPDKELAKTIAERARTRLEKATFGSKHHDLHVTASFGMTHGPSSMPLAELLAVADAALYEAKKQGRNQTAYFDTSDYDNLS